MFVLKTMPCVVDILEQSVGGRVESWSRKAHVVTGSIACLVHVDGFMVPMTYLKCLVRPLHAVIIGGRRILREGQLASGSGRTTLVVTCPAPCGGKRWNWFAIDA